MSRATIRALSLLLVATAPAAHAALCGNPSPYVIENFNLGGTPQNAPMCLGLFCQRAQSSGPEIALVDPACDPSAEPCSIRITIPFTFPGNGVTGGDSTPLVYWFNGATPPTCVPGPFTGQCGAIAICGVGGGLQLVADPDVSQVWLLTSAGTFHRFTDTDTDGTYDQVEPTNDYRTLAHDPATGWTLTGLDGTVDAFDTAGLWQSRTDRNGNITQATYGGGLLERVDLPDERSFLFAYDASGLLQTITEEGGTAPPPAPGPPPGREVT